MEGVWRGFGGQVEGVSDTIGGGFGGSLQGRIWSPDPPLEDDKSSSSPKERGTLVQRTCARDLTRLRPWGLANFQGSLDIF